MRLGEDNCFLLLLCQTVAGGRKAGQKSGLGKTQGWAGTTGEGNQGGGHWSRLSDGRKVGQPAKCSICDEDRFPDRLAF